MYIALEGADGSGKSTQIVKLREYFEKKGRKVVITGEPNDSLQIGSFIRKILQGSVSIPSVSIQYLMSADRADNHENVIYPALQRGDIVISHRSFWSAIPYGLLDKGIEADSESEIQYMLSAHGILSLYHQFIAPDFTFYLDIPVDLTMERMKKRGGKQELYEKRTKVEKIISGYRLLRKAFPDALITVDATGSISDISDVMIREIEERG